MESGDTGTSVAVTRPAHSSGVRPGFFSQRKASSWEAERHGDTALHGSAGTFCVRAETLSDGSEAAFCLNIATEPRPRQRPHTGSSQS